VLVTNGAQSLRRAKSNALELAHRFDHTSRSRASNGFGKPEERAYLHAMKRLRHRTGYLDGRRNLEWEGKSRRRSGWNYRDLDGVHGDGLRRIRTISAGPPSSVFVTKLPAG